MGKKKIAYLITRSHWGGAQKYVFELAKETKDKGWEPLIITGGNGLLIDKAAAVGIKVFSLKNLERNISVRKEYLALKEIFKILKEEKPDILHLNSSKSAGLGAVIGRLVHTPKIIFTAHGWPFNEDRFWIITKIIWIISWISSLLSTKVIVLSKKEYKQATKMPFVKNKTVIIPIGIEPFDPIEKEKSRHLLIPTVHQKQIVGVVAEQVPNKGLDYLIEAFGKIKNNSNTALVLIGDGYLNKNLKEKVKKEKISNVFFLGNIEEASRYLKAFDIFCLPSRKEGLPYAILEAGISELPVIASRVGGIPEIIENEKEGYLIPTGNTSVLAEKIDFLLTNPEKRQKLGFNLHRKVLKKFSKKEMLEKTISLY